MNEVFICDYIRTPIGRFGGVLSSVRPDDLMAIVLRAIAERNAQMDLEAIDEVILGCANQAGEDNRNIARMSLLLAGYPECVPGMTINRLCGSGMDAVITAARAIKTGEVDLVIAGGVESMSRAPFVMPKAASAFSRNAEIFDTTIGWRFINPQLKKQYGTESMPETAENVSEDFNITRQDQDIFALRSQEKAAHAQSSGRLAQEIVEVLIPQRKGDPLVINTDEHPRVTNIDALAGLKTPFRDNGTITAGNASGVNDGAAALILASPEAAAKHGLMPIAKVMGGTTTGLAPRIMGYGPAPASKQLLKRLNLTVSDFDVIELNEAFASQSLAALRDLGIDDNDARVNINGGAIALGHPLGMSGARITGSAALELRLNNAHDNRSSASSDTGTGVRRALATMCIGVGQGIAIAIESV